MIERWIDWERRLEGARMTSVNIGGQRYQLFDEDAPYPGNVFRVWQVKRMRASGAVYAADFFGHSLGVVDAPSWSMLENHPAVYMKATDLQTSEGWFDEVRLNLGTARRRGDSFPAPVRSPGGQLLGIKSGPLRVKTRKQRSQPSELK